MDDDAYTIELGTMMEKLLTKVEAIEARQDEWKKNFSTLGLASSTTSGPFKGKSASSYDDWCVPRFHKLTFPNFNG